MRIEDVPEDVVKEIERRHMLKMLAETQGVFDVKKEVPKKFHKYAGKADYVLIGWVLGVGALILYKVLVK